MSKFEKDLSQGSVAKQLFAFALPFIISNLIQTLYNVADMIIVGQFSGPISMSGVNIGGQITLLMTNLVVGLGAGATVLIAQYLGSGDRRALKETIATLFTSLAVLAVILTFVMLALQVPILKAIQTPVESFSEARKYLLITACGTVFIFGYNALSSVMRGLGDSNRPLIFVSIACVINVILDLILVGGFKMGAMGAGIATVTSQGISMILCVIYLRRNDFIFDFNFSSFEFHKNRLKMLFKLGVPMSIQNVTVGISFLFLTAMVNSLGVIPSAALGAVGKLNGFAILPAIAISSAISAMAAQNIGAGESERAVETMKIGMLMAAVISFFVFFILRLFPEVLLRAFANDSEMIKAGVIYIKSFSFDYVIVPFVFSLNGLFIACGHTTFSLINGMISSILVRIPVAYLLGMVMDMGLYGVGFGAPFASAMALILGLCFFFSGRWKKTVILQEL
ncbi:MAG: MATE family efflux transporter [Terrisporobacter sp.]|uniref:MATE family efflux transporter n=1 Tax=Terrisporobacter sp. TaxID=1965305 RepID=UPI002FC8D792